MSGHRLKEDPASLVVLLLLALAVIVISYLSYAHARDTRLMDGSSRETDAIERYAPHTPPGRPWR